MKKKVYKLILMSLVFILLTGCGNSVFIGKEKDNNKVSAIKKATIVDKEGKTVEMTSKELKKIYDQNEAKFDKYYKVASITLVGTVKSVETNFREIGSSTTLDAIVLEEGWEVNLPAGYYEDTLIELSAGDLIYVDTNIFSCFKLPIDLRGTSTTGGYTSTTLKQTKIMKVTGMEKSDYEKEVEYINTKKEIYNGLTIAQDKLEFVSKYAGNTNTKGSRKFDDKFLEQLKNSTNFENLNLDEVEKKHPGTKKTLEEISSEITSIHALLVDMGNTNSSKNVNTIKTNAKTTLTKVNNLIKTFI